LKIMLQMMDYFQIIFILLTMILNLVQLMIWENCSIKNLKGLKH
jgi:hypothetical protein